MVVEVEVEGEGGRRAMEDGEKSAVTLEDLKRKMAEFARERDWDQFHSPRNLLLALVTNHFFLYFATNTNYFLLCLLLSRFPHLGFRFFFFYSLTVFLIFFYYFDFEFVFDINLPI